MCLLLACSIAADTLEREATVLAFDREQSVYVVELLQFIVQIESAHKGFCIITCEDSIELRSDLIADQAGRIM